MKIPTDGIENLVTKFGLLFLAVWVVAAALGKGNSATIGSTKKPRNHRGGSNMYRGEYSVFGCVHPGAKNYQSSVAAAQEASAGQQQLL